MTFAPSFAKHWKTNFEFKISVKIKEVKILSGYSYKNEFNQLFKNHDTTTKKTFTLKLTIINYPPHIAQ
jgi:hypothetical protein